MSNREKKDHPQLDPGTERGETPLASGPGEEEGISIVALTICFEALAVRSMMTGLFRERVESLNLPSTAKPRLSVRRARADWGERIGGEGRRGRARERGGMGRAAAAAAAGGGVREEEERRRSWPNGRAGAQAGDSGEEKPDPPSSGLLPHSNSGRTSERAADCQQTSDHSGCSRVPVLRSLGCSGRRISIDVSTTSSDSYEP